MPCLCFVSIWVVLILTINVFHRPFGRLWWDETVPTVVTRAEPHNQVILSFDFAKADPSTCMYKFMLLTPCISLQVVLHPEQDRVLTIRENARLQGFPDYYKLCGPVKER